MSHESKLHTFLCIFFVFQHVLISEAYQLQNVLQKEFLHFKQSSFDCGKENKVEEDIYYESSKGGCSTLTSPSRPR